MTRQSIAFDYSSPAELYLSRRRGRHTDYRRFATAAEAISYAVEELRTHRFLSAWMQVGEDRFNKNEINQLYDNGDYPLAQIEVTARQHTNRRKRGTRGGFHRHAPVALRSYIKLAQYRALAQHAQKVDRLRGPSDA
jgi:hypothetical protein